MGRRREGGRRRSKREGGLVERLWLKEKLREREKGEGGSEGYQLIGEL